MSIYRPPGYGPAPTVEEHRAAAHWCQSTTPGVRPGFFPPHPVSAWLWRAKPGAEPCIVRLAATVSGTALYVDSPSPGHDEWHVNITSIIGMRVGEWCAIGPDGLPCAIGTPPETERERLERAFVEARRNYLAAVRVGHPCRIEHCDFYLAAYTLADHIIKETAP